MDARIDPPSSMHGLTAGSMVEVWVLGQPPIAGVFLPPTPQAPHVGKLAVAAGHRGRDLAPGYIDLAESRASAPGRPALAFQTRIELVENHAALRALGFAETAHTAHPGFDRPTSITFRRPVPA